MARSANVLPDGQAFAAVFGGGDAFEIGVQSRFQSLLDRLHQGRIGAAHLSVDLPSGGGERLVEVPFPQDVLGY